MPKIKRRPTPAQARLIRALFENEGRLAILLGDRGAQWFGFHHAGLLPKLLLSSAKALKREGWVELRQGETKIYDLSDLGRECYEFVTDEVIESEGPIGVDAETILAAIHLRFAPPDWAVASELAVRDFENRRIDAWAMRISTTDAHRSYDPFEAYLMTWAFEIKIDRGDWLRELEDPRKHRTAMMYADLFCFCAPKGVIQPDEVPKNAGLMVLRGRHRLITEIEPTPTWTDPPDWWLVASILRSMRI